MLQTNSNEKQALRSVAEKFLGEPAAGEPIEDGRELLNAQLLSELRLRFGGRVGHELDLEPPSLKVAAGHVIENLITQLHHEFGAYVDVRLVVTIDEVSDVPGDAGTPIDIAFSSQELVLASRSVVTPVAKIAQVCAAAHRERRD